MPELRWRALALIACVAHAAGSTDAAILLMKIAAETARQLLLRTPDRATFQAITEMRQQLVYANLIGWLASAGRFPEAERLHLAERAMASFTLTLTRRQADRDSSGLPRLTRAGNRGGFGLAASASERHPYFWASHVLYST